MRSLLFLGAVAAAIVIGALGACPDITDDKVDTTSVEGSPYGADFSDSSAGHKVIGQGAADTTVVRIAPRPDLCAAIMDPTDEVDPSLIFVIQGTQPQSYLVVPLDYQGPPGGGAPPPTATVSLQTHTSACDSGVEDAAGISCAVTQEATGGEVVIDEVVEGDLATGAFAVDFPEGGTVSGTFYAPACISIR